MVTKKFDRFDKACDAVVESINGDMLIWEISKINTLLQCDNFTKLELWRDNTSGFISVLTDRGQMSLNNMTYSGIIRKLPSGHFYICCL